MMPENADILFDLSDDAAEQHVNAKNGVCGNGKDVDLVQWSRNWRKKIEPLYYKCAKDTKKSKLHDIAALFDPLIRIKGKCDGEEDCNFQVSHTDTIKMPAGSILTLPETIEDVLKALEKHEIAASDMTFAYGTTGLFKYELRYRIEDGDKLIGSHNVHTGEENPKFPQELQPRDRTRAASQLQIKNIATNMNPDLLLVDFRSTDRGAPIIYKDMIVESGNGRTMALLFAADQLPAKIEDYKKALRMIAPAYALDPADVGKYRVPILVRERLTEVNNRKSFVDDCNARTGLAMSAIEQAKRDAEKITFPMMSSLELLEGESFDQALRVQRNNSFLVQFLNSLAANDRAQLVDAKGVVNSEGVRRAILATFVATFKGEVGLRLAQAQFEELDNDVKVALAGIAGSLGFLAQAENLALSNAREASYSIGEDLAIAVRKWGEIKRITDYTVDKYLAQMQMGTRELTPFQERLLKVLSLNARSAKRTAAILTAYAHLVIDSPPPGQASFMMGARLTKEELFESAVKAVTQSIEAERAEAEARKRGREMALAELFDPARLEATRTIPREQIGFWSSGGSFSPATLPIPGVRKSNAKEGWKLDPCQDRGVQWLKGRSAALLADDMGIGKTAQAIHWGADHLPALVIAPTSLIYNWQREIIDNWRRNDTALVLNGSNEIPRNLPDWTIVSYGMLAHYLRRLRKTHFQAVIIDEAHKVKNLDTQRTQAVLSLVVPPRTVDPDPEQWLIPNRLAVTGTPIVNRPIELFPLLVFLGLKKMEDMSNFMQNYTESKIVNGRRVYTGAKNLYQLNQYLKTFMLRRLKDECLPDLPPKRHTPMFVAISNAAEYMQAERNFLKWLAAKKGNDAAFRAASAEIIVKFNELRHLAALGKVRAVADWMKPCGAENKNKIIVFSSFLDTLNSLAQAKKPSVVYSGQTKAQDRQSMVDKFQKDPNLCFFMGTTPAAGVGITLTAADRVVFMDLPWTPGDKKQAEDRAHRRGQKRPVEIVNVLAKGTIDERMLQILADKEFIISQAVDGKTKDQALTSSIAKDLLDAYIHSPSLGEVPCYKAEEPEPDVDEIETSKVVGMEDYSNRPFPVAVINDSMGVTPPEYEKYKVQLRLDYSPDWSPETAPQIHRSSDLQQLFSRMRHADREWLLVICLDTQLHLLGVFEQAIGAADSAVYSHLELARIVIKTGATRAIIAHNHPSGTPDPSEPDRKSYEGTKKAFDLLQVGLLDWIIVGYRTDYSLATGTSMPVPTSQLTPPNPMERREVPAESLTPAPEFRRKEPVMVRPIVPPDAAPGDAFANRLQRFGSQGRLMDRPNAVPPDYAFRILNKTLRQWEDVVARSPREALAKIGWKPEDIGEFKYSPGGGGGDWSKVKDIDNFVPKSPHVNPNQIPRATQNVPPMPVVGSKKVDFNLNVDGEVVHVSYNQNFSNHLEFRGKPDVFSSTGYKSDFSLANSGKLDLEQVKEYAAWLVKFWKGELHNPRRKGSHPTIPQAPVQPHMILKPITPVQGKLFDVIDKIADRINSPNMTRNEVRESLSWKPLRELLAWAAGSGHPVQLYKVGMVEGTYQVIWKNLTPTLLKHISQHVKDVPRIRRVYTPDNEAIFEVILPGSEKKELEFLPQEIRRQPRLQPAGVQGALLEGKVYA